jgi:hypothetical protein
MSVASRPVSTGKTRTCPHCKATILESLSICPGCMHHLRFDSEAAKRQVAAAPALRVEGLIRHPPLEQPLEYFVIIAIRNDRGEEVTRQVVNVGALQAAEKRTFTLSVEVLPPQAPVAAKSTGGTGTFKAPTPQPATAAPAASQPQTPAAKPAGQAPAAGQASVRPGSAPNLPKPGGAAANPAAPSPGQPKPNSAPGQPGTPAGNPANTAGQPKPGDPAAPAKPTSGYVLKPPSPGGPKRH